MHKRHDIKKGCRQQAGQDHDPQQESRTGQGRRSGHRLPAEGTINRLNRAGKREGGSRAILPRGQKGGPGSRRETREAKDLQEREPTAGPLPTGKENGQSPKTSAQGAERSQGHKSPGEGIQSHQAGQDGPPRGRTERRHTKTRSGENDHREPRAETTQTDTPREWRLDNGKKEFTGDSKTGPV